MSKTKKRKAKQNLDRRIPFELNSDEVGKYIVYCHFPWHESIIGNGRANRCIENYCSYYEIFRPESRRYKK